MVCAIFDLRLLCQIICRIDWNFHLSCCQKCCKVCCVRWNHDEGKKPPYTSHTPGRNCPVNKGSAIFVQIHSFMPWIGRTKTYFWIHTLVLCPTPVALDCPSCARDNYGNWLWFLTLQPHRCKGVGHPIRRGSAWKDTIMFLIWYQFFVFKKQYIATT